MPLTIKERRTALQRTMRGIAQALRVFAEDWRAWEDANSLPPIIEERLKMLEEIADIRSLKSQVGIKPGELMARIEALGLTIRQTARYLGVTEDTLYRCARRCTMKRINLLKLERLEKEILASPATLIYRTPIDRTRADTGIMDKIGEPPAPPPRNKSTNHT